MIDDVLNKKVEDLDFSSRLLEKLKAAKITTLKEVTEFTESDVAYLLNKKSFHELVQLMKRYNLRFKPLF